MNYIAPDVERNKWIASVLAARLRLAIRQQVRLPFWVKSGGARRFTLGPLYLQVIILLVRFL
jgi:hypothetical protein